MRLLRSYDDGAIGAALAAGERFWLDLDSPDAQTIGALGARLSLHQLAIDDSLEFGQRAKFDDYGDHALLVVFGFADAPVEFHLHLGAFGIVTIHRNGSKALEPTYRFIGGGGGSGATVLYRILDTLADSFFPELDRIGDEIDALTGAMLQRPSVQQREELFLLRRRLVGLRRVTTPQRDVLARDGQRLAELDGIEDGEAHRWLRDVYDHLVRISEEIDTGRDLLAGALDIYLSTVSNRLNEISKQLAIVATIFLPLTFITGFFGQNFGMMVRHINSAASFWVFGIGGLVVSCLLLYWWFRRSGWLGD